jgi:coenzyme Q-binding protein COQ10
MKSPAASIRSSLLQPRQLARRVPAISQTAFLRNSTQQPSRLPLRRTFFSLADVAKLLPNQQPRLNADGEFEDPNSQKVHVRKILPYVSTPHFHFPASTLIIFAHRYTREQLYKIVADVPSYSNFIPFCTTSSVVSPPAATDVSANRLGDMTDPFDVKAELEVGFGNFAERYTSRVQGVPYESVKVSSSRGNCYV